MMGLTAVQLAALRFIVGYQAANGGISPSCVEVGTALGWKAKSRTAATLACLEERGAIRRLRRRQRAIEVLAPVAIPSVGGEPLYAVPLVSSAERRFSGERV